MSIVKNSLEIAKSDAVRIWGMVGAQYINNIEVLHPVEINLQSILGSFALNARRVLESFDKNTRFKLDSSCWSRSGMIDQSDIESDLWKSLNLIIHARSFEVIFETLPDNFSYIGEDNRVVTFIKVSTDMRQDAYFDPFSMAYSFLSDVRKKLPLSDA